MESYPYPNNQPEEPTMSIALFVLFAYLAAVVALVIDAIATFKRLTGEGALDFFLATSFWAWPLFLIEPLELAVLYAVFYLIIAITAVSQLIQRLTAKKPAAMLIWP